MSIASDDPEVVIPEVVIPEVLDGFRPAVDHGPSLTFVDLGRRSRWAAIAIVVVLAVAMFVVAGIVAVAAVVVGSVVFLVGLVMRAVAAISDRVGR
jgi:MFS superfamily sulfate permease-like transporter